VRSDGLGLDDYDYPAPVTKPLADPNYLALLNDPGTWINAWRTGRHIRLLDMANACGIAISTLSSIEQGHTMPSIQVLRRIVEYINKGGGE